MPEKIHLKSREMNEDESKALLEISAVGRIGTANNKGMPYITPVNYVYERETGRIYIHHSSRGGKLLDNLLSNANICFEVDEPREIVNLTPGMHICDGDQAYRSVICHGKMSVADKEDKLKGLTLLGNKYFNRPAGHTEDFDSAKLDRLVVLMIEIKTMSGKCREVRQ